MVGTFHKRAASQMEKALRRWEKAKHTPAVVSLSVADLLAAAMPGNIHLGIHELIEPQGDVVARPRTPGRWSSRVAGLSSHAVVLAMGGILGWVLHRSPASAAAVAPSSPAGQSALLTTVDTQPAIPAIGEIPSLEPPTAATAPRHVPALTRPLGAASPRVAGPFKDEQLLDQALAAVNAGDGYAALAALAALSTREGYFGSGPRAGVRQRLLVRACTLAGARAEPGCAGMVAARAD